MAAVEEVLPQFVDARFGSDDLDDCRPFGHDDFIDHGGIVCPLVALTSSERGLEVKAMLRYVALVANHEAGAHSKLDTSSVRRVVFRVSRGVRG
jgi:hypothetical protein